MGEEPLHGRRDHRQDARHHRLRQHRLDRRRARHRPEDEGRSPTIRTSPRSAPCSSASRRSNSTSCSSAPTSSPCIRRSPRRPATSSTRRRSPRCATACASSTAPAAAWSSRTTLAAAIKAGKVAGAGVDVFVKEPAENEPAVRPAPMSCARRTSARRPREAQENVGDAGGRADGRLPGQRRGLQRAQHAVDHGGRGAAADARSSSSPRTSAPSPASSPRRPSSA